MRLGNDIGSLCLRGLCDLIARNKLPCLRLRLGNAGGVRVFYNGRELDRGRQGQVRNWNFPLTPEEMPN